jgi:catechol 2,3-dioxygenase-like lactoylglutathione lyase family enzyme
MPILVNMDVPDLARAIEFYTHGLGLDLGRRFDDEFVELVGGGVSIFLIVKPVGSAPIPGASEPTRMYTRHWTPVHLDFVVDDVVAARDRAMMAGAIGESDITDHAYGRQALMADPFGNGFCLLQFTGRGYDEIAT